MPEHVFSSFPTFDIQNPADRPLDYHDSIGIYLYIIPRLGSCRSFNISCNWSIRRPDCAKHSSISGAPAQQPVKSIPKPYLDPKSRKRNSPKTLNIDQKAIILHIFGAQVNPRRYRTLACLKMAPIKY